MDISLFLTILDKPIVFHRPFLRIMNTNCALFLSQCLHWQKHTKYDGWFAHTIEQFEFETGLSKKEQLSAKKTLQVKNILIIQRRGNPSKNWYTINLQEIYQQLKSVEERERQVVPKGDDKSCQKGTTSRAKRELLVVTKGDDKSCQKGTTSRDKRGRLVVTKGDDYNNKLVNNKEVINKEVLINSINTKRINTYSQNGEIEEIKTVWNRFATEANLPKIMQLTQRRISAIKARQRQKGFDINHIFECIRSQDFLLGNNDRGWTVTFDFVFGSANNWVKIVENNYPNRKTVAQKDIERYQSILDQL